MFVDSNKSMAEIEAAIREQESSKKAAKKRSSKRVVEPTRMVVEPKEEAAEESSEVEGEYNHTYGLRDLFESKGSLEGMEHSGVTYEQKTEENTEGATLNGMSLADIMGNL